jgi:MFS family permease
MANSDPHQGTPAQGILLCLLSTLSVAAALLIAPVLPAIAAAFPHDPQAQTKSILALAVPALVVALTAPIAGHIVDRFGRKGVLLGALVIYLVCGLLPFVLVDLNQIILSRLGVGLAESGFMTASTALIGDYFKGARRQHWLVVQTSTASVAAVVLVAVGGILGGYGWRTPFAVYGLALLFLPLVMLLVREPKKEAVAADASVSPTGKFPLGQVLPLYVIGLFAAILFFLVPIQTPFLLTQRGMGAPQIIGLTSAAGGIAVPVGGLIFKFLSKWRLAHILSVAFALIASGVTLFVGDGHYVVTCAGIVITGIGCGITLPAVLTAIMSRLSFAQRGRGTGGWQTAFFLGNFASPVIVLVLTAKMGGLPTALLVFAGAGAVAFVISLLAGLITPKAQPVINSPVS